MEIQKNDNFLVMSRIEQNYAFSGKSEPLMRYLKNVRADLKVLLISLGDKSICFAVV